MISGGGGFNGLRTKKLTEPFELTPSEASFPNCPVETNQMIFRDPVYLPRGLGLVNSTCTAQFDRYYFAHQVFSEITIISILLFVN